MYWCIFVFWAKHWTGFCRSSHIYSYSSSHITMSTLPLIHHPFLFCLYCNISINRVSYKSITSSLLLHMRLSHIGSVKKQPYTVWRCPGYTSKAFRLISLFVWKRIIIIFIAICCAIFTICDWICKKWSYSLPTSSSYSSWCILLIDVSLLSGIEPC